MIRLEIRAPKPEEMDAAKAVYQESFKEHDKVYRLVEGGEGRCHPDWNDGSRLIGIFNEVIISTVQLVEHDDHLHIYGLAVIPIHRKKWMAKSLLYEVGKAAKKAGKNKLALETIKETGNVPIFEKLGFEIVSEEGADFCESDTHDKVHTVKMMKVIS